MDQWVEVAPVGSNIWIVPRMVYASCCVCVANRSSRLVLVSIDFAGSENHVLLVREPGRGPATSTQQVVFPGATVVVATLSPIGNEKMKVVFSAACQEASAGPDAADDLSANLCVADSLSQSVEIEGWLKRRAVKRLSAAED